MPFKKGTQWGKIGGQLKGYEFNRGQLQKMKMLLDKDLEIHEKIQNGEATEQEKAAFAYTAGRIKSIYNKLHADKKFIESVNELAGGRIIQLKPESIQLVKQIILIETGKNEENNLQKIEAA